MSVVKVVPDIYWVGARDFAVRDFHGYKTPYGTTYNAFLILDEKVTLADTVKAAFADEMIANIRELIDPAKIDCVVRQPCGAGPFRFAVGDTGTLPAGPHPMGRRG